MTSGRALRERPRRTASCSSAQSFDWLCEQGHVGLERVAKARRDPALVAPVTAALEVLATIYARLRRRRLGAGRGAREPAAAGRARPPADRNGDRGRRPRALHLVAAGRARPLPAGSRLGFDIDELPRALPRAAARAATGSHAACRPRASASAACSASAPTTTRCAISRRRRWGTRRSCGSRRRTATARPPTRRHRRRCGAQRRLSGAGRDSSITATLTVRQRPQRTRTFFVM